MLDIIWNMMLIDGIEQVLYIKLARAKTQVGGVLKNEAVLTIERPIVW